MKNGSTVKSWLAVAMELLLAGIVWANPTSSLAASKYVATPVVRSARENGNEANGIPQSGLVAYYPFSGNCEDASGKGHHLTNTGGVFVEDRFTNSNQAISFDGRAHYAEPTGSSFFLLTNTFTVACWFKTAVSKATYGSGSTAWNEGNYILFPHHGGNNAGVGLKVGTDGVEIAEHGSNYMPTKWQYNEQIGASWNHVCLVVQGPTKASVYLNGKLLGTATLSNRVKYFNVIAGGGGWGYYTGQLDELCVYNRVLTEAEIVQLHDAGGARDANDNPVPKDPWVFWDGRYEIVEWTKGWLSAKTNAVSRGGHLATITSEEEWNKVVCRFGDNLSKCWLGATDAHREGSWEWVTGETWEYSRWHSGEPNNSQGVEHYLVICNSRPWILTTARDDRGGGVSTGRGCPGVCRHRWLSSPVPAG